jgi:ABC-type amino acid transport substrate-binding protein
MRFGKWVLLVFALAMIVAACGGGAAETTTTTAAPTTTAGLQTLEPGILTIGSDIPYPPFEDFDASGNVIGFDADLMNEIASRLGLTPRWVDTDFDTIFTKLAQGNFATSGPPTTWRPWASSSVSSSSHRTASPLSKAGK